MLMGFMPPPMPPPAPPPRDCRKASPPMMSSGKARLASTPATAPPVDGDSGGCTAKTTLCVVSALIRSADCSGRMSVSCRLPSLSMESTCLPSAEKETFSTWSVFTASRNVEYAQGELRAGAHEGLLRGGERRAHVVGGAAGREEGEHRC